MTGTKHFLDIKDFDGDALRGLIADARARKTARDGLPRGQSDPDKPLEGHVLAMIFEKPSTRTRVSFDVGIRQLGGRSTILSNSELQLGRGETIADTARVLSRYVDAIMIRTTRHENLEELAAHASVPVINGLTNSSHPCQIMADVMTFEEHKGSIKDRLLTWVGDGANNMASTLIEASVRFGFRLNFACPDEFQPGQILITWARDQGAQLVVTTDPKEAASEADCVLTDTWVSMGDEDGERRRALLTPYQVDDQMMAYADKDAIFMHCLPAHRGEEVATSVIEGPQSVVFEEAENRLHAQKAILAWCLS